jgi:hypothetical protein
LKIINIICKQILEESLGKTYVIEFPPGKPLPLGMGRNRHLSLFVLLNNPPYDIANKLFNFADSLFKRV